MMDERNAWIAARAYALWEQSGRPQGHDNEHWDQAVDERERLEQGKASPDGAEVMSRTRTAVRDQAARTVLVVDDEADIRFNVVDRLDEAGFETHEAANASEALVLLRHHRFDTLLTDVNMPGNMDGLGLAYTVRSLWPATKVIVTSGLVSLQEIDLERGIFFLPKPTSMEALIRSI